MSPLPPNSGVRRDCTCPRSTHRHGTTGAYYRDRCRCVSCATAYKRYRHDLRVHQVTVPAVGIRRRLDALATLGWTHAMIGARLGITGQAVQQARVRAEALPETVARFAAVYDELWNRRPEPSTYGERVAVGMCLALAARRGYAPPLAWDDDTIDDPTARPHLDDAVAADPDLIDEVAVTEALNGRPVGLTDQERTAAVLLATAQGWSMKSTAERLAISVDDVRRRKAVAA